VIVLYKVAITLQTIYQLLYGITYVLSTSIVAPPVGATVYMVGYKSGRVKGSIISTNSSANGKTNRTAAEWRDWTLAQQKTYNSGKNVDMYSGGIKDSMRYIDAQAGKSSTSTSGAPTWSQLKSMIQGGKPFYSRWGTSDEPIGHALVICGYRYNDENQNLAANQVVYAMDPNKNTYVSITPYATGSFSLNGKNYDI